MVALTSSFGLIAIFSSVLAVPMPTPAGTQPFTLQNGQEAIALNIKFQTLTETSPCTNGEDACVNGQFAQCAAGKFALTSCAGGTSCAALPLVNKAGTSVTCTTVADKNARIAATGATAPAAGSASVAAAAVPAPSPAPASVVAAATPSATAASAAPAGSKPFTLQNGKDAQALNAKFAGLSPSSPCTAGQNACVNSQFAQCVNGKFALTPCAAGLQCFALPLVNSAGTSLTCVDQAQALARISATGAGNTLTGN